MILYLYSWACIRIGKRRGSMRWSCRFHAKTLSAGIPFLCLMLGCDASHFHTNVMSNSISSILLSSSLSWLFSSEKASSATLWTKQQIEVVDWHITAQLLLRWFKQSVLWVDEWKLHQRSKAPMHQQSYLSVPDMLHTHRSHPSPNKNCLPLSCHSLFVDRKLMCYWSARLAFLMKIHILETGTVVEK